MCMPGQVSEKFEGLAMIAIITIAQEAARKWIGDTGKGVESQGIHPVVLVKIQFCKILPCAQQVTCSWSRRG